MKAMMKAVVKLWLAMMVLLLALAVLAANDEVPQMTGAVPVEESPSAVPAVPAGQVYGPSLEQMWNADPGKVTPKEILEQWKYNPSAVRDFLSKNPNVLYETKFKKDLPKILDNLFDESVHNYQSKNILNNFFLGRSGSLNADAVNQNKERAYRHFLYNLGITLSFKSEITSIDGKTMKVTTGGSKKAPGKKGKTGKKTLDLDDVSAKSKLVEFGAGEVVVHLKTPGKEDEAYVREGDTKITVKGDGEGQIALDEKGKGLEIMPDDDCVPPEGSENLPVGCLARTAHQVGYDYSELLDIEEDMEVEMKEDNGIKIKGGKQRSVLGKSTFSNGDTISYTVDAEGSLEVNGVGTEIKGEQAKATIVSSEIGPVEQRILSGNFEKKGDQVQLSGSDSALTEITSFGNPTISVPKSEGEEGKVKVYLGQKVIPTDKVEKGTAQVALSYDEEQGYHSVQARGKAKVSQSSLDPLGVDLGFDAAKPKFEGKSEDTFFAMETRKGIKGEETRFKIEGLAEYSDPGKIIGVSQEKASVEQPWAHPSVQAKMLKVECGGCAEGVAVTVQPTLSNYNIAERNEGYTSDRIKMDLVNKNGVISPQLSTAELGRMNEETQFADNLLVYSNGGIISLAGQEILYETAEGRKATINLGVDETLGLQVMAEDNVPDEMISEGAGNDEFSWKNYFEPTKEERYDSYVRVARGDYTEQEKVAIKSLQQVREREEMVVKSLEDYSQYLQKAEADKAVRYQKLFIRAGGDKKKLAEALDEDQEYNRLSININRFTKEKKDLERQYEQTQKTISNIMGNQNLAHLQPAMLRVLDRNKEALEAEGALQQGFAGKEMPADVLERKKAERAYSLIQQGEYDEAKTIVAGMDKSQPFVDYVQDTYQWKKVGGEAALNALLTAQGNKEKVKMEQERPTTLLDVLDWVGVEKPYQAIAGGINYVAGENVLETRKGQLEELGIQSEEMETAARESLREIMSGKYGEELSSNKFTQSAAFDCVANGKNCGLGVLEELKSKALLLGPEAVYLDVVKLEKTTTDPAVRNEAQKFLEKYGITMVGSRIRTIGEFVVPVEGAYLAVAKGGSMLAKAGTKGVKGAMLAEKVKQLEKAGKLAEAAALQARGVTSESKFKEMLVTGLGKIAPAPGSMLKQDVRTVFGSVNPFSSEARAAAQRNLELGKQLDRLQDAEAQIAVLTPSSGGIPNTKETRRIVRESGVPEAKIAEDYGRAVEDARGQLRREVAELERSTDDLYSAGIDEAAVHLSPEENAAMMEKIDKDYYKAVSERGDYTAKSGVEEPVESSVASGKTKVVQITERDTKTEGFLRGLTPEESYDNVIRVDFGARAVPIETAEQSSDIVARLRAVGCAVYAPACANVNGNTVVLAEQRLGDVAAEVEHADAVRLTDTPNDYEAGFYGDEEPTKIIPLPKLGPDLDTLPKAVRPAGSPAAYKLSEAPTEVLEEGGLFGGRVDVNALISNPKVSKAKNEEELFAAFYAQYKQKKVVSLDASNANDHKPVQLFDLLQDSPDFSSTAQQGWWRLDSKAKLATDTGARFYINARDGRAAEYMIMTAGQRMKARGIPFKSKFAMKAESFVSRVDNTVIWVDDRDAEKVEEILRGIAQEKPELIDSEVSPFTERVVNGISIVRNSPQGESYGENVAKALMEIKLGANGRTGKQLDDYAKEVFRKYGVDAGGSDEEVVISAREQYVPLAPISSYATQGAYPAGEVAALGDEAYQLQWVVQDQVSGKKFVILNKGSRENMLASKIGTFLGDRFSSGSRIRYPEMREVSFDGQNRVFLSEYAEGYEPILYTQASNDPFSVSHRFHDRELVTAVGNRNGAIVTTQNIWFGNWDFKSEHMLVDRKSGELVPIDLEYSFGHGLDSPIITERTVSGNTPEEVLHNQLLEMMSERDNPFYQYPADQYDEPVRVISSLTDSDYEQIRKFALESGYTSEEAEKIVADLKANAATLRSDVQYVLSNHKVRIPSKAKSEPIGETTETLDEDFRDNLGSFGPSKKSSQEQIPAIGKIVTGESTIPSEVPSSLGSNTIADYFVSVRGMSPKEAKRMATLLDDGPLTVSGSTDNLQAVLESSPIAASSAVKKFVGSDTSLDQVLSSAEDTNGLMYYSQERNALVSITANPLGQIVVGYTPLSTGTNLEQRMAMANRQYEAASGLERKLLDLRSFRTQSIPSKRAKLQELGIDTTNLPNQEIDRLFSEKSGLIKELADTHRLLMTKGAQTETEIALMRRWLPPDLEIINSYRSQTFGGDYIFPDAILVREDHLQVHQQAVRMVQNEVQSLNPNLVILSGRGGFPYETAMAEVVDVPVERVLTSSSAASGKGLAYEPIGNLIRKTMEAASSNEPIRIAIIEGAEYSGSSITDLRNYFKTNFVVEDDREVIVEVYSFAQNQDTAHFENMGKLTIPTRDVIKGKITVIHKRVDVPIVLGEDAAVTLGQVPKSKGHETDVILSAKIPIVIFNEEGEVVKIITPNRDTFHEFNDLLAGDPLPLS
jgi:hypothetical protein